MTSREELLKQQRQNATPEERQVMALEGIHDMMVNIQSTLMKMEGSLGSLTINLGEIAAKVKNPNFGFGQK